MNPHWWNRSKAHSRPAAGDRRRPGRRALRPRIEGLETRELKTVSANLVNGQLQVFSDNGDNVALDHAGLFTFVNGKSFADSLITDKITMSVGGFFGPGLNTVTIRSTVRPVTVESPGARINFLNIGKAGVGVQEIQAPVSISGFDTPDPFAFENFTFIVDDSANTHGQRVTLDVVNSVGTITGLAPFPITFADEGFSLLRIKGGSGGNTFNILETPFESTRFLFERSNTTLIESGAGNDFVNVRSSHSTQFTVFGAGGQDSVTIGSTNSLQNIFSKVLVNNVGGHTALFVNDSATTFGRNVTMGVDDNSPENFFWFIKGLTPRDIRYVENEVSSVTVTGGSGVDTFTIDNTFKNNAFSATVLNTGPGSDTVHVRGTTGMLTIDGLGGFGIDKVDVGTDFGTAAILGDVFVRDTVNGRVDLTVTDAPGTEAHTAVVLDHTPGINGIGTISGLAPALIQYINDDVGSVTLVGSSNSDTIFVRSTPTSSTVPGVNIEGGAGNDQIVVGSASDTLDTIDSVSVKGGDDFDTLIVNDQGSTTVPHTYTEKPFSFSRTGGVGGGLNGTVSVFFLHNDVELPLLNKGLVAGSAPMAEDLALSKSVRAGELATLTGRLVDPDEADALTLSVDWGDGSEPETSTPGREPFRLQHSYGQAGTYTVRVIWTDSQGQSNSWDFHIKVKAPKKGVRK